MSISDSNPASPVNTGCMIVVVGPSGAGKDSVIAHSWLQLEKLRNLHLVRRVVTRPADPQRENHHSVSKDEFREKSQRGEFAVEWSAHNLHYGIPQSTIHRLNRGYTLIANGSRAALSDFRTTYRRCQIIWITAPEDVLAARLVKRNTESIEAITKRLQRSFSIKPARSDIVINNTESVEQSATQFVEAVLSVYKDSDTGHPTNTSR